MPKIIKTDQAHRECVSNFEHSTLDVFAMQEIAAGHDPVEAFAQAQAESEARAKLAYDEGLRKGLADGEQQFRESVGQTAQVLRDAADKIEQAHRDFLDEVEPQLIRLATSIASKIIDREARTSDDVIKRTVRAALEKTIGEEQITLRVNPRELGALRTYRSELLGEFENLKRIELVADDSIDPGGCIAQTDSLRVDGRLDAQLEKILNELLG